jgi:hypothetical protein
MLNAQSAVLFLKDIGDARLPPYERRLFPQKEKFPQGMGLFSIIRSFLLSQRLIPFTSVVGSLLV